MKIIFKRQRIMNDIAPLLCAVSGKSTLTAIEGILIEAHAPDSCVMTTYDLEKGMRLQVEAEVIEDGSFIINATKFSQTLKVMEGDSVTLTVDDKLCATIESGKSSHKMNALAGADFPALPSLRSEMGFTLRQKSFREMLDKTMYAMGVNDQRMVLNGAFVKIADDGVTVISCDSFKLAKCELHTAVENNNTDGERLHYQFIIPNKTVGELYKLLSDKDDETIRIYMMRKHMVYLIGGLTFFTRLIEGEYIDFDRIILKNHKIHAYVNKNELIAALERAALITEERIAGSVRSPVKLELCGDLLKITAVSTAGTTYDEISVEHDGGDITISFNNRYLIDSVSACEGDEVKLSLSSPLASVNIEPTGYVNAVDESGEDKTDEKKEDLFMLLPVRTKD